MNKSTITALVAAFAGLLLSSCAGGPAYREVKASLTPQSGKGLAVIYCKGGFVGAAAKIPVYANDELVTKKFQRGGFYTYEANPGQLHIALFPTEDKTKKPTVGQGAAAGALGGAAQGFAQGVAQGATLGASAGPIGMVAGAVGGAIGGAVGVKLGQHEHERAKKEASVMLNVKAGGVYYMEIPIGTIHGQWKERTRAEAEKDLQDCHWLNPAK